MATLAAGRAAVNPLDADSALDFSTAGGGAVASAVGARLERLSKGAQVLVVTHSPQVAARGHAHWKVRKADAGGVTTTTVDALDDEARREEIARMLSGAVVTDEARAAARSLIG
jgi:DNA repair protein RecN (Recombination protein N)